MICELREHKAGARIDHTSTRERECARARARKEIDFVKKEWQQEKKSRPLA